MWMKFPPADFNPNFLIKLAHDLTSFANLITCSSVYLLGAIDRYIAKKEDENMKNISSSFLFKVVPVVELQSTSR